MPSNREVKEARKAWLESREEGVRRCDEAECGNNEAGEVRPDITKLDDQRSKTVDPRKDELDGRTMEEPPSLATRFLPL